jgi:hypothetical protein
MCLLLVGVAALGAAACPALARDDAPRGATPPRLGFVDGDVSFWRPGAADWASAQVNTALAAGDSLYAGDGGNFELQTGPRAFVRGGANTQLGLESLEPDYMQLKVTGGSAVLDLKQLAPGRTLEIDTPTAAFTVDRAGYYRIDVDENTSAFIARRGGSATVIPENGETVDIGENQRVVFGSTDGGRGIVNAAPELDAWDRWNYDRTAQLGEAPRSAQYVPREVAGVDDLDRYGDWRDVPEHGHVWVPRDTAADWAPYSTGRWVYDPNYEWTWIDDAPWGWAPYHYGRWVNTGEFWGWAPGPIVATPVYAPALVAFFGAPGVGVSVGAGLPFVSWCALGFGEPVIPWWGGSRFAGRPYWGGWGGPRYVNNVVMHDTTMINARTINRFQNMNVRNAMVGIDRGQFGRGRGQNVRLAADHRFEPMHGQLGVTPVAASLVPNERPGRRPPDRLRARQVVATRTPQDPRGRLRTRGLDANAPSGAAPAPRIVNARRGPQGRPQGRPDVARDGRRSPEAPSGAPGVATPQVRGEPREHGHGGAVAERTPPTPPPNGARPRAGRPPTRPELAAPPSPPNAQQREGRRTGGNPMQRPAPPPSARRPAPPAPRQERATTHQRELLRALAERRTPGGARHEPRVVAPPRQAERPVAPPPQSSRGRMPAARNETRGPERARAQGPSSREAPSPSGQLAEHSPPATERREGPPAHERPAPQEQHGNQGRQHGEKTRGEVTP